MKDFIKATFFSFTNSTTQEQIAFTNTCLNTKKQYPFVFIFALNQYLQSNFSIHSFLIQKVSLVKILTSLWWHGLNIDTSNKIESYKVYDEKQELPGLPFQVRNSFAVGGRARGCFDDGRRADEFARELSKQFL